MLRGFRPSGPYALAGWKTDSLVALEMARLLEEQGEKVTLVALLDASGLLHKSGIATAFLSLFRPKLAPPLDFMADALRRYHPRPWFGKIVHLGPSGPSSQWRLIAPHGIASFPTPSEMLAEPNVQIVATILSAELRAPEPRP
jgi:hypothetical protein